MHNAVITFIKEVRREFPHKFRMRKVLEVGSHNINGSPRRYFWLCKYVGVDLTRGKGVDMAGPVSDVCYKESKHFGYYDVVISTETLEHDKEWAISLRCMYDLLKPGGLFIMTCAGPDRKIHGVKERHPEASPDTNDYYRNISTEDFRSILPEHLFDEYVLGYARGMNDLQFYGTKPYLK